MSSAHVVYLGSLNGIQEQNLLLIRGPFLAQFCPIPVSWACASILDIFAVPGNASVVLLASPPRGEESVFNQLITRDSGQHLLLILNLAKGKNTPLSITHSLHSSAKTRNPV